MIYDKLIVDWKPFICKKEPLINLFPSYLDEVGGWGHKLNFGNIILLSYLMLRLLVYQNKYLFENVCCFSFISMKTSRELTFDQVLLLPFILNLGDQEISFCKGNTCFLLKMHSSKCVFTIWGLLIASYFLFGTEIAVSLKQLLTWNLK